MLDSLVRALKRDESADGARQAFVGPHPSTCFDSLTHASHPNDLIGCFASAQRSNLPPAWADQKVDRKLVWRDTIGVEEWLIVPTLYSCDLVWDGSACDDVPEFIADGEGGFTPSFESIKAIYTPSDPRCRAELCSLLRSHGLLVLKPAVGANSKGVLLLSTTADGLSIKGEEELTGASASLTAIGEEDHEAAQCDEGEANAVKPTDGLAGSGGGGDDNDDDDDDDLDECGDVEPRVWVGAPIKTWRSKGDGGRSSLPFGRVWREMVIRNPLLCGTFLAEPIIPHDQELCVLAINGGRLLVLAGRSLCMERIVRLAGEGEARVAESDFEIPEWFAGSSVRSWRRADAETRARHTRWALTQIVEGDSARRTVSEVLLDTAERLASRYFDGRPGAAIRVDYFVRWGADDGSRGARVWVNEVEHGFNPASIIGWYGARLTTLALQFWLIGGSTSARAAYDRAQEAGDGSVPGGVDDRTRPATDDDFHALLGQRVVLHGLSARGDLNGCTARVMSWHANTGRAGVQLLDHAGSDVKSVKKMLAIRPDNLTVITPAPDEPTAQPW